MFASVLTAQAIPAWQKNWKTVTLTNGSVVEVILVGDEHGHAWISADGKEYMPDGKTGRFREASQSVLKSRKALQARHVINSKRQLRLRKVQKKTAFAGQKKGLIIMVEFADKKFQPGHDQNLYHQIANAEGFSQKGFHGSVRDYFKEQSYGKFDLSFDVVGPVQVSRSYSYYGENDKNGQDSHPEEMVLEALRLADKHGVDFSKYDWDGDGEVDQVYILYAGYGEADNSESQPETIWPHEYELGLYNYNEQTNPQGSAIMLDGVMVNTYACSNEISAEETLSGIGSICHEFSHCLGFPDMYDTNYTGNFGMGEWDLMNSGSHNGDGFIPAGYTSYEKMQAGWLTPQDMTDAKDLEGTLPAIVDDAKAYIIYNKGNKNEYYLVENRQQKGFDAGLPSSGVLVLHVDYDENIWEMNNVNTVSDFSSYGKDYVKYNNDHERLTIFHADNDDDTKHWTRSGSFGYYTMQTLEGDVYPYQGNNSLNRTSAPAATLYHANADGSKYMQTAINDIKVSNGIAMMTFTQDTTVVTSTTPVNPDIPATDPAEMGDQVDPAANDETILPAREVVLDENAGKVTLMGNLIQRHYNNGDDARETYAGWVNGKAVFKGDIGVWAYTLENGQYTGTQQVADDYVLYSNSGSVYCNGNFYSVFSHNKPDAEPDEDGNVEQEFVVRSYDAANWTKTREEIKPVSASLESFDMAYDARENKIYGLFQFAGKASDGTDDFGYKLATFDPETFTVAPITKGLLFDNYAGLAIHPDGRIFAIKVNGDVVILSRKTGTIGKIVGNMGFTSQPQRASAAFDDRTGRLYWIGYCQPEYDPVTGEHYTRITQGRYDTGIYEVNPETGVATQLHKLPYRDQITGLWVASSVSTGIETISADKHSAAVYYTLDGVRISSSQLGKGVYLVKEGNQVKKVIIK